MKNSRILAITVVICLAIGLFSGCANNDSPAINQPYEGSPSASDIGISDTIGDIDENAGLSNLDDGVLDVGTIHGWESLTPFRNNTADTAPYAYLVYETLAKLTSDKEYIPWVAKSWSAEGNGRTFNIEIYDYVVDNVGNKITAADIVWMIEASIEAGLKPAFAKIESVEQVDEYNLKVTMKQNMVGAFEEILINTYVVSKAAYEASADGFATSIASTSTYEVVGFEPSIKICFENNENYWQKEELVAPENKASIDKINFHVITEASQAGIALETGVVDCFVGLDANTAVQFEGNDDFALLGTPSLNAYQIFFSGDPSRVVAEDTALRQAICYAINCDGFVQAAFSGYAQTMYDPCADTTVGYLDAWRSEDYYSYNIEKARALLEESEYDGETLVLLGRTDSTMVRICEMLQAFCGDVGIDLQLNLVEPALYGASRLDGTQYDIVINNVSGTTLPAFWSIRYDCNAYSTGDATSRHDEVLAEMLYDTWTLEGYTEENIDSIHKYIKDNMYAYGLVHPMNIDIWSSEIGLTEVVSTYRGFVDFSVCEYAE